MQAIKLRITKADINGEEGLVIISLNKDGRKINMTMSSIDSNGQCELIVDGKGNVVDHNEVGYEDYELI